MKHEKIINRADGSSVKIVAELFTAPCGTQSIGNYVLTRGKGEVDWKLVKDDIGRDKSQMSVEDYIKHGRKPMFYAASPGELLAVNQKLLNMANEGAPKQPSINRPKRNRM